MQPLPIIQLLPIEEDGSIEANLDMCELLIKLNSSLKFILSSCINK